VDGRSVAVPIGIGGRLDGPYPPAFGRTPPRGGGERVWSVCGYSRVSAEEVTKLEDEPSPPPWGGVPAQRAG